MPRGAAITLACRGGRKRGCPFKSQRVVRSATKANHTLLPSTLKRRLAAAAGRGSRSASPRRTGASGAARFAIRRGKAPKRSTRCRQGEPGARYRSCS